MAEPTTTTGTAAALLAVATALFSAFITATGLTPGALVLAMLGALFGAGFAPPAGRVRAVAVFAAATVLSAKAGIASAAILHHVGGLDGEGLAQAGAAGFGVFLHPLVNAVARLIPALAQSRLGVQPPPAE